MELNNNNNRGNKKLAKSSQTSTALTVQKNIEKIMELEKGAVLKRSRVEQIADKVTAFAGSTPFIMLHIIWFGGWILINSGFILGIVPFDPFPFSFLTLVVSLEAIFLTLLVLMSQNQMTKEADKRSHLDLQINMLNEQETTVNLRMLQKIARHLGMKEDMEDSLKDLCEETDVNHVAEKLNENFTIK